MLGALAVVRAGCRSAVGDPRDGARPGARLRAAWSRSPRLGVDYGAPRPGGDAGHARLLGRAAAQLAVPRGRVDVLVRGTGARGRRYGLQAMVEAMGGGHAAARADRARARAVHATLAVLGFDVMRYAAPHRAAALARPHRRAVALYLATDDPRFARPRLPLARPALHLGRLRDLRDRDVRRLADARHERRRRLPLHADAARHADRADRLVAAAAVVDDVRRRLRRCGDGRDQPLRRRRRPTRRDAVLVLLLVAIVVQGICGEHHERLHGRPLARELGPRLGRLWATLAAAAARSACPPSPTSSTARRPGSPISAMWPRRSRASSSPTTCRPAPPARRPGALRPDGRYRYLNGVSPATLGAVAIAVTVYYVLPASSVKAVWGIAVARGRVSGADPRPGLTRRADRSSRSHCGACGWLTRRPRLVSNHPCHGGVESARDALNPRCLHTS